MERPACLPGVCTTGGPTIQCGVGGLRRRSAPWCGTIWQERAHDWDVGLSEAGGRVRVRAVSGTAGIAPGRAITAPSCILMAFVVEDIRKPLKKVHICETIVY